MQANINRLIGEVMARTGVNYEVVLNDMSLLKIADITNNLRLGEQEDTFGDE